MLHTIFEMFRANKGKGILVFLYLLVANFASILIVVFLQVQFGGIFLKADVYVTEGIAFLLAAVWTHLTKYDYYKNEDGIKIRMDTVNAFLHIKMAGWAVIFLGISLMLFFNSLFHYFPADPL